MAAALAALALAVAAGGWAMPDASGLRHALDWQPGLGASQPWRAFTAAAVHGSPAHLAGNLAATALVAALGWQARVSAREAAAWALSWPLTQALLGGVSALAPAAYARALPHYGGLSGVLHAGVVVAALSLLMHARAPVDARRQRLVGAALLAGTVAKALWEAPWHLEPQPDAMLGIAVAPVGHATGVMAGALCFVLVTAGRARGGAIS